MKQLIYLITIGMSMACHQPANDQNKADTTQQTTNPIEEYPETELTAAPVVDIEDQQKKDMQSAVVAAVNAKPSMVEEEKNSMPISKSPKEQLDSGTNSARIGTDKTNSSKVKQQIIVEIPKKIEEIPPAEQKDDENLHHSYNELLKKYVSDQGVVDYVGFQKEQQLLKVYLEMLSVTNVGTLEGRAAKMAFWINLYNAATIDLILKNYPVTKIIDLDGGKPWDVKRIQTQQGLLSLNDIENGIIRPDFKDARIHFAVNCAAKSCPPLANQAYTKDNLDALMTRQAKAFINNKSYNEIGQSSVTLSKIFEWYADDFTKNIIEYINIYSSIQAAQDAQVTYKEYDWSLNGS